MPPDQPLNRFHPALIALAGFLIGALAASAWFFERSLTPVETTSREVGASISASSTPAETSAGENIISVHDQSAGASVQVDSVTVPAPGVWVAIAEINDNALGNVLGAARVQGPATDISVPLLRNTLPGSTYAVVLYRDNGDGVFDVHSDSIYIDFTTGERVVALFRTSL